MKRWRWPWVLAAIVLLLVGGVWYDEMQFGRSDRGFRHVTGVDLPTNVTAHAHRREMNDNLFHTTHYWLLRGPHANLQELAKGFGFQRSDEDSRWILEKAATILPMGSKRLIEGYEGTLGGGRDRWLVIAEPGDQAVFAF